MTQALISMDKKYRTREGCAVRVLCTDLKGGKYPVAAAILIAEECNAAGETIANSAEIIRRYTASGSYIGLGDTHPMDLVEISPVEGYKVDDPVWVRDSEEEEWIPRYFAKYEQDTFYAWVNGATSFSANGQNDIAPWKFFTKENPND